ncbi:MAG: efflux transporter outer membrane subunit [Betaproteobacteria bacterium]|nr:efflux transporter outer membrane subunit [Betaproteobacteria bacterium]
MTRRLPRPALLLALALSACSVGPDFRTPDPPATKTYTSEKEILTSEQRSALGQHITTEWGGLFASVPLNALISQAFSDNYDIAAARETLVQAEASVKAQSGSLMPQASLDALAGRQKYGVALFGPSNFFIPPFTYYEAGPSLSWTLDLFGGGQRRVERQQALADYQSHELDAMYVVLSGNVVSQAIALATVKAEIATLQRILAADEKTLVLVQASFEAGAATRMDILEAQSRLMADRALLPPLKQRSSLSYHTLSVLVGKAPADWSPPDLDFDHLTLPETLPLSLPSELVRKRPDILAAEANLHAASATVGVATANLYPSLTLSADMFQEALTPTRLFYGISNAWALAGGLSVPIFNGGTLSAEKREAEHAYLAALAEYRQTVVRSFSQVADALAALAHDAEMLDALKATAATTRASLDLAQKSYEAGNTGLLQIEAARRAFAQAELHLVEVRSQHCLDATQLFVALGGSPKM